MPKKLKPRLTFSIAMAQMGCIIHALLKDVIKKENWAERPTGKTAFGLALPDV
ncbi:MAG: hypothetical protein HQK59_16125 [Deltaproteobacteria bacterium]|nr:hypothetical protein [Deltaproteobacteria bacterium]